jgi:hypothetical protein
LIVQRHDSLRLAQDCIVVEQSTVLANG